MTDQQKRERDMEALAFVMCDPQDPFNSEPELGGGGPATSHDYIIASIRRLNAEERAAKERQHELEDRKGWPRAA